MQNLSKDQCAYDNVGLEGALNRFLEFNQLEVLIDKEQISHQQAEEKAVAEYEKFRIIQDREIMSDFDQQLKLLLNGR